MLLQKKKVKKELLDAIELLGEKYKNAIYLVNIENLSYQEIVDILGETLSNTKSLVHRGKKQLRKKVKIKLPGQLEKNVIR